MTKNERAKLLYYERIEKGICVTCGRESSPDYTRCESCREKNNGRKMNRYHANREQGLCGQCGGVPREEHTLCEACIARQTQAYQRYWNNLKLKQRVIDANDR